MRKAVTRSIDRLEFQELKMETWHGQAQQAICSWMETG